MLNSFFIFNNLKTHPFILHDQPIPGFKVIDWNSWTIGTLWVLDIVEDVGYTVSGSTKVYGQLWRAEDINKIELLERYCGAKLGISDPIKVNIHLEQENNLQIQAVTFALNEIKPEYKKLDQGKWRF